MDSELADNIVKECVNHYQSLTKRGKPILGKEWTLLSAIIMTLNNKITVVAMATGTKCLGRNKMSPRGDLVNDSHAEVLARRCFLRFLYDQIAKFQQTGISDVIIGCNEKNQFEINPEIKFHLYSSHVPCGDASIIPKQGEKRKCESNSSNRTKQKHKAPLGVNDKLKYGDTINCENKKYSNECLRVLSDDSLSSGDLKCECLDYTTLKPWNNPVDMLSSSSEAFLNEQEDNTSLSCVEKDCESVSQCNMRVDALEDCVGEMVDIHRTGAKCLLGEDRKLPGVLYHQVGAVRTKPGRGDPTLSVSCSDKMSRWLACGLQGALLSLLLSHPVMLTSVIIGGGGQFSAEALRRALLSRTGLPHSTVLLHSSVVFPHSRYLADPSAQPCSSAILWARVAHKPLEVCVEGRRQGATKNCRDNGRLMVCKLELLKSFLAISNNNDYQGMSYKTLKAMSESYNNAWSQVKQALTVWTVKPSHLEVFKIDS